MASIRHACSICCCFFFIVSCSSRNDYRTAVDRHHKDFNAALTQQGSRELATLDPVPLIEITAQLDEAHTCITGHQRVWLPNTTSTAWPTVAVRIPANNPAFGGASLLITHAQWNGVTLSEPDKRHGGVGLVWTLPQALESGASGYLDIDFTTTLSTSGGYHGLLARQNDPARQGDTWCLYHWHPEIPSWENSDWRIPPMVPIGDQTQTGLMHIIAHLTIPTDMQLVLGGRTVHEDVNGATKTLTISAPLVRNLAGVAGRHLACIEEQVGETTVRSWYHADVPHAGRLALTTGIGSLRFFSERLMPYPYTELDIVQTTQDDDVGGMESSGLVLIDGKAYDASEYLSEGSGPETLPIFMLMMATAHEVAHQWCYTMVGNDSFRSGWIDESLTNWLGGWYAECTYGPAMGASTTALCLMGMKVQKAGLSKALDLPMDGYTNMTEYGIVVYERGTIMYQALRHKLGDQGFTAWLRDYVHKNRWGIVTPDSWRSCLIKALGETEADAFIDLWIKGHGMTMSVADQASKPIQATTTAPIIAPMVP